MQYFLYYVFLALCNNTSPIVDSNHIGLWVMFGMVEMNHPTCTQWLLHVGTYNSSEEVRQDHVMLTELTLQALRTQYSP